MAEVKTQERRLLEFENSGKGGDEIVLEFGDKNELLYVNRYVLCSTSPVFKAMFEHSTKEAKEGRVKIEDFKIEDFNELLMCIDPRTQKKVTSRYIC